MMEDVLIQLLKQFTYPVRRQGSLTQDEKYPDHFFTFWNIDSDGDSHYDNRPHATIWEFDVNFYSVDPDITYKKSQEAINKLKGAGFIISGKGYDVASDEPSHTGRGFVALFIEREE